MKKASQLERLLAWERRDTVALSTASWIDENTECIRFSAPHQSRVIANGIWFLQDDEVSPEKMARLRQPFDQRRHDFNVYFPSNFEALPQSLQNFGYTERIQFPILYLDAAPRVPVLPPHHHFHGVTKSADLATLIDLCAASFEFSPSTIGLCQALLSSWTPSTQRHGVILYQGLEPRACAMVNILEKHALVDWVATAPAYRRRGYGSLVTAGAVQTGFAAGANAAVLHASKSGESIYRKLGFRPVGGTTLYAPPPRG